MDVLFFYLRMMFKSFRPGVRHLGWLEQDSWWSGLEAGFLKVFVGLDAKNDVLVGAAPRLLAQEQT